MSQHIVLPDDDLSRDIRRGMDWVLQLLVQSEDELEERQSLSGVSFCVHGGCGRCRKEVGYLSLEKLRDL